MQLLPLLLLVLLVLLTGQCQQTVLQRLQPHPNRLGTDIAHIHRVQAIQGKPPKWASETRTTPGPQLHPNNRTQAGTALASGHAHGAAPPEPTRDQNHTRTDTGCSQLRLSHSSGQAKRDNTGLAVPTVKIVTNYHRECTVPPAPAPATAALALFAALGRGARCGGLLGPG